jgi:hypothetical protein
MRLVPARDATYEDVVKLDDRAEPPHGHAYPEEAGEANERARVGVREVQQDDHCFGTTVPRGSFIAMRVVALRKIASSRSTPYSRMKKTTISFSRSSSRFDAWADSPRASGASVTIGS